MVALWGTLVGLGLEAWCVMIRVGELLAFPSLLVRQQTFIGVSTGRVGSG